MSVKVTSLVLLCVSLSLCAHAEERYWQETVHLHSNEKASPCTLQLVAVYEPAQYPHLSPWPHAQFSAGGDCLTTPWRANSALRVLRQHERSIYAIDERFSCQTLKNDAWQACELTTLGPLSLVRNVWGPIRVASNELQAMHEAELRLLSTLQGGGAYQTFNDSFSEQLWVHRFCGKPNEIVHHFERWTACLVRLNQSLATLLPKNHLIDYPQFTAAKIR